MLAAATAGNESDLIDALERLGDQAFGPGKECSLIEEAFLAVCRHASGRASLDCMQLLIDAGADPSATDAKGKTSLILAAISKY
eukprot:COSAG04_NODE_32460_length_251_cov_0.625000_1_plen_83_part_11